MRKLKLLLTGFALLGGVFSANAQTDVTSTYITNPGFEGDTYTFYTLQSGRTIIKPNGWSVSYTQESTSDKNTQSFVSASETMDKNLWSAIDGKAYFFRCRWTNATFDLRQTIGKLLPGNYTLKFYAKGVSGDGMTLQASVAGQNLNIPLVADGTDALTEQSIAFTITSSTPYATIHIHAAKSGGTLLKIALDEFSLWYDGSDYYSTLLTEAQSLYDNNSDWAENADALQTAITEASGKATVEDKNSAIFALQTAMQTFKDANTVDMTTRLVNPNFDSNISGWVTSGSDGTWQRQTSTQNNYSGGFIETWRNGWNGTWNHKNLDMHQVLTSLPSGEYTVKAAIGAVMQGSSETQGSSAYGAHYHGGPYYVDDNHGAWLYATSGETTTTTWANTENNNIATGTGPEYFTTTINVTNGSLTIGAKAIGSDAGGTTIGTYTNWFSSDNWTLSYFGFDPSTLKDNISDLKTDVQAIIDGDEVPTAVKTSLQNTLDDLVETPETKTVLDAAVNTLEDAISAANATKTPYAAVKALIDFVTEEKTNSTGTKTTIEAAIATAEENIETRTTVSDLESDYTTLEAARQTYVTSGAQPTADHVFDMTFKIADAAVTGTGWSASGTASGQQYTGAPDNKYFDCGWNSSLNKNQTVESLPAGYYTMKAATRAKASEITSANIYVNQARSELNRSTNNHRDGNTGGTLGNGWSWTEVDFELRATGNVTVGFYAQTTGQGWAGADDFHLYYKGNAVDDETADALIATVVSGKMNSTVAGTQASALSAFESAQTIENYEALEVAIAAASASKDAYTHLKAELDKMPAAFGTTNVYTATSYATNYTDVLAAYTAETISTDDANAYAYGERVTGAMPAIMLSSWKVGEEAALTDASLYMNAWSTEGNSDGSEMTTPFYEYWGSDANALDAKSFTATVEGLTSGTSYLVTAKVRVRQQNDGTKADDDVTFQVNDGDVVNAADGTQSSVRSEMYYKTVRAYGAADEDGKLAIKVVVKDGNHVSWLAFKDVHYSEVTTPTEEHKTALADAITAAEAKTIGFDAGEYAPYTNIDARKALAAAKAIDVAENTDAEVVAATTALTGATWTANAEEMNAVSDELFNGTEYGAAGWTRNVGWNNVGGDKSYSIPAGTMTYGDLAYHEMPLEANTVYKLTFGHRKWDGSNADNGGQVSVLNAGGEGLALTSYTGTNEQSLQNEYYYFRTGEAGNYTFTVTATSGRLTFGNVIIKKAVAENITIAEDADYTPEHNYANITLTRTIKKDTWNTFVVPFDITNSELTAMFDDVEVAEYSEDAVGENSTVSFDKMATPAITANKPVLLKTSTAGTSYVFTGKVIKTGDAKVAGTNFDFVGTYAASSTIDADDYFISSNKLYKSAGTTTIAGTRAYLKAKAAGARIAGFSIDDEPTGISTIATQKVDNAAYDMQGRRVETLKKGVYVVNGKKVVIK